MAFKIPNEADAAFADQAEPDSVDLDILAAGVLGDAVLSGCAVTAQGTPDMTVAVASGQVRVGATKATVAGGNVTITAADATNARFDLITADNAGALAAVAGTPAVNAVFPAIPANRVVLAAVYVPANDTAIESSQIIDKRVLSSYGHVSTAETWAALQTFSAGLKLADDQSVFDGSAVARITLDANPALNQPNIILTGITRNTGRFSVGTIVLQAGTSAQVKPTPEAVANTKILLRLEPAAGAAFDGNNQSFSALSGIAVLAGSNSGVTLRGLFYSAIAGGTLTVTYMEGIEISLSSATSGVVTNMVGARILLGSSVGALTNAYGGTVENVQAGANRWGWRVFDPTLNLLAGQYAYGYAIDEMDASAVGTKWPFYYGDPLPTAGMPIWGVDDFGLCQMAVYTVAALPAGAAGKVAYASNGRKVGEGAGAGTGVLVYHDGTAWRRTADDTTVAA